VAYLNYLASVSFPDVATLQADPTFLLRTSKAVGVSHLIGYWVQVQPLGSLLGDAIDGGVSLNDSFWHPLRPPSYHSPEKVQSLHTRLSESWQHTLESMPELPQDDWYRLEIEKVLRLFRHAAEHGECVVRVLEPLADPERGDRVHLPFAAPFVR
jgi:hypothetical protein